MDVQELMDRPDVGEKALTGALRDIARVNRMLGGSKVLISALNRLRKTSYQPRFIVDAGCGGGDLTFEMARWVQKNWPETLVKGMDLHPLIIPFARKNFQLKNLSFDLQDVTKLKEINLSQVLLTCSMFLHHLKDDEIRNFFIRMHEQPVDYIIINDLHRNILAYWGFRLLALLARFSPMARFDGAASVMRGFKKTDWIRYAENTGWEIMHCRWRWAFRWELILKRKDGN